MAKPILITGGVGLCLRYWLSDSPVAAWVADRQEVSTPVTSWKRVTEGLALHKAGISPYLGDIFHETPLMLRVLSYFNNLMGPSLIYMLFILCDLLITFLLDRIAQLHGRHLLMRQLLKVKDYAPGAEKIVLKAGDLMYTRLCVIAMYLFNPYSIATCIAKSTATFNNLLIVLVVLYTLSGKRGKAGFLIALSTYQSMYPVMLIVPCALFLAHHESKKGMATTSQIWASLFRTSSITFIFLAALLGTSFAVEGNWNFLQSTYGFTLTVPDLTPNIGVFWYFFTEMFEHFRLFFICVFQINAFIYTVPLAVRLREHPTFLMFMLIALMSIFKSYPSFGDSALYLAFLPLWKHCFSYMRNNFIVACMFFVCTILAPVQYHLWIYAGSANANFYFAITLVFSTAQIFLVTDLLFGFLRREFDLYNGAEPKIVDGKPVPVILDG